MSSRAILGTAPYDGGDIWLDVDRLIESRMLIQANSGGGKSWGGRSAASSRAIAAKLGLEPHAAAADVLHRAVPHLTGLSRRDASTVIEHLQREETTRDVAR